MYSALSHLHQSIALLPMIADKRDRSPQFFLAWRIAHERRRLVPRDLQYLRVPHDISDLQSRQPGLLSPEKFARPAQLHIHFGDVESVARFHQRPNALAARVVQLAGHQNAVALLRSAPHATAKLMQLSEAEPLRLFDEHHRR